MGRIFRSTVGGTKWETVLDGQAFFNTTEKVYQHHVKVSANGNIIYALPSIYYYQTGILIKSIDGGDSWSMVEAPFNGHGCTIEVSKNNPDIIYVGAYGYLYLSKDGGSTWKEIYLAECGFGAVYDIYLDQTNPNRLYIAINNSVYRSRDGGDTWVKLGKTLQVNDPPPGYAQGCLSDLAVDNSSARTLYAIVSTDGLWKMGRTENMIMSPLSILLLSDE